MTFIAISILSAVFITMYLYLLRTQTLATEAQRLYAEAAQEKLEVSYNPTEENLTIRNTGGISVVLKYLVERDESAGQAKIIDFAEKLSDTILSPNETAWTIYSKSNAENELLIVTERGNVFRAEEAAQIGPGIGQFVMRLNPSTLTVDPGYSGTITLELAADSAYGGDPVSVSCNSTWVVDITPNPIPLSPGSTSTADVSLEVTGNAGQYIIEFKGVGSGGELECAQLVINIQATSDYILSVSPDRIKGRRWEFKYVVITLQGINNYSGTITLSVRDPNNAILELGFSRNPVTLTPENPQRTVYFYFILLRNGDVTIIGDDGVNPPKQDSFSVEISGGRPGPPPPPP
ncbi:hypothetical protein DRO30_03340 [Candidatus Bathyarchaeota archaeon]|nr:MAG: hypothetical protein DRO30_03340 [Candidatus Bathyarchaeota archaeon]